MSVLCMVVQIRYDGSVTARCANLGEAEGALCMFGKDAEVLRQSVANHRQKMVESKTPGE